MRVEISFGSAVHVDAFLGKHPYTIQDFLRGGLVRECDIKFTLENEEDSATANLLIALLTQRDPQTTQEIEHKVALCVRKSTGDSLEEFWIQISEVNHTPIDIRTSLFR